MKTTLNLDDDLYRQVKVEAARRGNTITSVVEEALRQLLIAQGISEPRVLPVSSRSGGLRPGVDLEDSAQLYALLYASEDRAASESSK